MSVGGLHHQGAHHLQDFHQVSVQTFKQSGSPEPVGHRTPGPAIMF